MSKAREIFDGWKNVIFPNKEIERLAKGRMLICNTCEHNSKFHSTIRPDIHCVACGCPLISKTKSPHSFCPKGKWGSVKTENDGQEQEQQKTSGGEKDSTI